MGEPVEPPPPVVEDPRIRYDARRDACPVARGHDSWIVLGHPEVVAAATDPTSFSSTVTERRAIPNSLDGDEHAAYREVVDRFLTAERVAALEPDARAIADELVATLPRGATVRTIGQIGTPFAVRTQVRWLGWPTAIEAELVDWIAENYSATRSGDRHRTAAVAERFDRLLGALIEERRGRPATDVTGELMHARVRGRALTDAELVSILRNWTAGDLGSLATSVGVIVHLLATRPEVQRELRALVGARDAVALEAAVEEILRIDDPFVSNRRRATTAVDLGGQRIDEGERVLLNWTAANRDPRVFADPDRFDPVGNAAANLVFGIGPHVCPGRALTLMELRVVTEALLAGTAGIEPAPDRPAVRETPPIGGWARVPVVLRD